MDQRAAQKFVDDRAESRVVASQVDHGAIYQLHRVRIQRDDVPRQIHRLVERREVHDAQRLVLGQRCELELDLAEQRERAFGTD